MSLDDIDLLAEELGGYWEGRHPQFTPEDWQDEVVCGDTRLGYWDWVKKHIEEEFLNDDEYES